MSTDSQTLELTEVLERLAPEGEDDSTTVGDLLAHFRGQAHGPLLLVPGLLAVSPVGAIPGMSLAMGAVITFVAIQMMVRSDRPWLPERVEDLEVPADRLQRAVDKTRPAARWLDRHLQARWSFLVRAPGSYVLASTCALLGLSMWPLALVPMGVAPPGIAVTLFGLALTLRSGLLALLGYLTCAAVVGMSVWLL